MYGIDTWLISIISTVSKFKRLSIIDFQIINVVSDIKASKCDIKI